MKSKPGYRTFVLLGLPEARHKKNVRLRTTDRTSRYDELEIILFCLPEPPDTQHLPNLNPTTA